MSIDDAFEHMVANQELDDLLDDPDWVPDEWDMRRFRAFNASPGLIAQAQRRIDRAEEGQP